MVKQKILMFTGDFTEDYETMVPFQMRQMVGHEIIAVCPVKKKSDTFATAIHGFLGNQFYSEKPGHRFQLNFSFDDVKPDNYDVLLICGDHTPGYLRLHQSVINMVRHFAKMDKPIAAFLEVIGTKITILYQI